MISFWKWISEKRRHLGEGIVLLSSLFLSQEAQAINYFGRIVLGNYLSSENFTSPIAGSTSNNAIDFSGRLYLKVYNISSEDFETVMDLRDKYDLFDKLDQQNLLLTPGNTIQAYQMNVRLNNSDGMLYGALGRFSLQEAGGVFSDGAEIGFRWTPNWRTSFFGGLEPKRFGQTYVGFNSDSSVFGTYTTYQLKSPSLSKNLYWSTALVGQNVQGNMDRLYWYNNTIYQWSAPNQVVAMVYLDFVPRLNIQSALISAHQDLSTTWATNLSLTAVDVIEYMRIQGVLQTLASSPYREAALNIRAQMYSGGFFDTNLVYGARTTDSLVNADISVGPSFYRLFDGHASFRTLLGARRHFDGNEAYTRVVGSYFSKSWEFNLSANFALNVQSYGSTRHKWINDLSATRFFSTDFLAVVSLQEAHDETVQIWSGLFRLSYIFGQKATAPIRDTAPRPQPPLPAGRLY